MKLSQEQLASKVSAVRQNLEQAGDDLWNEYGHHEAGASLCQLEIKVIKAFVSAGMPAEPKPPVVRQPSLSETALFMVHDKQDPVKQLRDRPEDLELKERVREAKKAARKATKDDKECNVIQS